MCTSTITQNASNDDESRESEMSLVRRLAKSKELNGDCRVRQCRKPQTMLEAEVSRAYRRNLGIVDQIVARQTHSRNVA